MFVEKELFPLWPIYMVMLNGKYIEQQRKHKPEGGTGNFISLMVLQQQSSLEESKFLFRESTDLARRFTFTVCMNAMFA